MAIGGMVVASLQSSALDQPGPSDPLCAALLFSGEQPVEFAGPLRADADVARAGQK
jgi:hypothetical protein